MNEIEKQMLNKVAEHTYKNIILHASINKAFKTKENYDARSHYSECLCGCNLGRMYVGFW